jgi:hypothetical protein
MGFCIAELGMSVREFLDSTNHEIFAAYEWWKIANCVSKGE